LPGMQALKGMAAPNYPTDKGFPSPAGI